MGLMVPQAKTQRRKAEVAAVLDRWISPKLLADPWHRTRARLCLGFSLLAIFGFTTVNVVGLTTVGALVRSAVLGSVLLGVVPLLVRRGADVRYSAIVLLGTTYLGIILNALEVGGLISILSWSGILTVGVVFLLGRSAGTYFILVALAVTIAMAAGHWTDYFQPLSVTMADSHVSAVRLAVMVALQCIVALVFARLYADEHRALALEIDEARKAADEANAAKSVFLASMSHEIRTPMNGVLAASDLLRRGALSPEEQSLAELVFTSGEALLSLLNDILDLSKLEAGKVELEARPFDPRELVRSVVELMRPRASQKQLELSAEVASEIAPQLIGDGSRLRQVLLNLVANAIKFTPAGRVSLRLGLDPEGRCCFTVEDTGIGMSPEQIGRLFKPFEQGSASTHRTHGGTGLGLAISARLVEAMGAKIGVVSSLGRGSRFDFAITMAVSDAPVVRAEPKARAPSGRGQGLVLIVDDNDTNRRVAEAMVRKLGHPTRLAKDGEEALKLLGEIPVAAVLMDWQMPVLDGLSATRMLRARSGPERSTPIIALTASAMHEEVTACIDAGMNEVLAKPLTLNALAGSLGRWAGERRPE